MSVNSSMLSDVTVFDSSYSTLTVILETTLRNHAESSSFAINSTPFFEQQQLDPSGFLQQHLGVRRRSRAESAVLTIVYSVIFLTGLTGNVCTAVVVVRKASMRTSTNFYLCSLATSDIATLIIGLPPELYSVWEAYPWKFGRLYCLFKTFLTEMTSSASILTIAAFTVERYVAICHPLRAKTLTNPSRSLKVIAVIWIAACATALPYPVYTTTYHYLDDPVSGRPLPDSLICNIPAQWLHPMRRVFQFSTFVLFVLPMTLISALYVRMGLSIRRSGSAITRPSRRRWADVRAASSSSSSPPNGRSNHRKSVLKMLVAVVVAFFLCWAPFHAQRLLTIYTREDQWTATLLEIQTALFYISGILYFVSCTVNPILYNLLSRRYRQAFRDSICASRRNSSSSTSCCSFIPLKSSGYAVPRMPETQRELRSQHHHCQLYGPGTNDVHSVDESGINEREPVHETETGAAAERIAVITEFRTNR